MTSPSLEALPPRGIGFIGIGVMGRPMVLHLLAKRGLNEVSVHHRSRDRVQEALDAGATWAASARELAERSRVIILMLPDLPQVEEVLSGPDGILAGVSDDTVIVIGSTSSASGVRALASRLAVETNDLVRVVDAPVSGGEEGAASASLSIMVGGAERDVRVVMPILSTMGTPVHLGALGAGEITKFCNQLIVGATVMALGEAAVIAQRSGLDLETMFTVLEGGYAGSRVLETRKDRIVSGEFGSSGMAKYMTKDLGFAAEEALATGTSAAQLELLQESFAQLTRDGFGDSDISVTRAWVQSQSRPQKEPDR